MVKFLSQLHPTSLRTRESFWWKSRPSFGIFFRWQMTSARYSYWTLNLKGWGVINHCAWFEPIIRCAQNCGWQAFVRRTYRNLAQWLFVRARKVFLPFIEKRESNPSLFGNRDCFKVSKIRLNKLVREEKNFFWFCVALELETFLKNSEKKTLVPSLPSCCCFFFAACSGSKSCSQVVTFFITRDTGVFFFPKNAKWPGQLILI